MDFRSTLIARAQKHPCRVLLPESDDARVLQAAARAQSDGIAHCIMLGDKDTIASTASNANITLPPTLQYADMAAGDYIEPLMHRRAARGKTIDASAARAMLANPTALAAMLVASGNADAMVAGAITTSADVLRPALQIIGLQDGAPLASSAFLMCFNDGMRVFADCALNIAPSAEQLTTIAAQSVATAQAFGLDPVVAMLSYASGNSGAGENVNRVADATAALKIRLPEVPITGPIQYDAATTPAVAKIKLPNDPAAGNANVLIFPDLQSGNITYKAVQHAANIVCIGPLMQGLAAPVNDLSRGATAEDIYHTIAATVVQAGYDKI